MVRSPFTFSPDGQKAHGAVTFHIQSRWIKSLWCGHLSHLVQMNKRPMVWSPFRFSPERHAAWCDQLAYSVQMDTPHSQWCGQLSYSVQMDTPHSPWCGQLSDLVQMDMAKKPMVWTAFTFSPDGHGQKARGGDSFQIQSPLLLGIGLLHTVASTNKATFLDKQIHPNVKHEEKNAKTFI